MSPAFAELRRKSLAVPCTVCRVQAGQVCQNTKIGGQLALVPAHHPRLWACGAVPRPGARKAA